MPRKTHTSIRFRLLSNIYRFSNIVVMEKIILIGGCGVLGLSGLFLFRKSITKVFIGIIAKNKKQVDYNHINVKEIYGVKFPVTSKTLTQGTTITTTTITMQIPVFIRIKKREIQKYNYIIVVYSYENSPKEYMILFNTKMNRIRIPSDLPIYRENDMKKLFVPQEFIYTWNTQSGLGIDLGFPSNYSNNNQDGIDILKYAKIIQEFAGIGRDFYKYRTYKDINVFPNEREIIVAFANWVLHSDKLKDFRLENFLDE